ncbi:MAG: response regulator [Clostridia bacterium]|jgi:two-component SAPR family response regulator|nr:response regulator [Clostridia bacterium]MBO7297020.1 response regulator [Clostridia bacterium]
MIVIAVDDEALMLGALAAALEESPDISEVNKFSDCDEALEFAKNHPIDIAFLDINMRGMGGLALAESIVSVCPACKIVFCTGYEEYAIPAFKLHASGYLMKPISAEDVQGEIDNIKGVQQKAKLLTVKCFGNFEIYANNEMLTFKRLKTKELFAFLVDRNGAGMTAKQICAVLFPDDTDDTKNAAYLRQLVMDLKNTLRAVGAEAVLCHETPCYRVDTALLKCDYFSYLETGKPEFHGEYMTQYSWAEETCAMLLFK